MPVSDAVAIDAAGDGALLMEAVRDAGRLALRHFEAPVSSWDKADGTPVSEADLAVNELLRDRLTGSRPDYGWLSEENEDVTDRMERDRVWVVDPIDGTRSFLERSDNWCVSVALVERGRPVLAAVHAPTTGDFYQAALGAGALLNGETITTSGRNRLAGARMMAHRKALRRERWQAEWPDMETGMTTSIALRLCLVAQGRFDATLAIGDKSDWDLAAGDLIVHEAGGRVSTFAGEAMRYNGRVTRQRGLVASAGTLHDDIVSRTRGFIR